MSQDLKHDNIVKWVGGLLGISGWILMGGLMIALITNSYNIRIERTRKGLTRYRFRQHQLIIGWDRIGLSIVRKLLEAKYKRDIVIMTDDNADDLRNQLESSLPKSDCNRIYVMKGDFCEEELRKLYLEQAERLVILGNPSHSGCNNENLALCVFAGNILSAANKQSKLPCHVSFPSIKSYDFLQEFDLPENVRRYVDFIPFNFYDGWARRVWGCHPLKASEYGIYPLPADLSSRLEHPNAYVHIVIAGFNAMGQAIAVQAAHVLHFAKSKPTVISIFDPELESGGIREKFLAECTGSAAISDIRWDFQPVGIYSAPARRQIIKAANDPDCIMSVILCVPDSDEAMVMYNSLPLEIYENKIPVLVRLEGHKGLPECLSREANNNMPVFNGIRFFGFNDVCCSLDSEMDNLAKLIHSRFVETAKKENKYTPSEPKYAPWEDLSEKLRWSNRYQADSFYTKLYALGIDLAATEFSTEQLEKLARMEHDRWWAERLLSGWRYGIKRDDCWKIHPNMVAYCGSPLKLDNLNRYKGLLN